MSKHFFKPTIIALALVGTLTTTSAMAKMGESRLSPTIKGWAPYLPSVGTRVVGRAENTTTSVKIGDIIEVPTYLINEKYYTYADGNNVQDKDADNDGRSRSGQHSVDIDGNTVTQKVSVHWYVVEPLNPAKTWAPANTTYEDFNVELAKGDASAFITRWEDVKATPVVTTAYTLPVQGNKSLALKVPVEATGKRIGFIIVPESQTGDPARGQPLKVPDLNYIWEQPKPQGPGDQCDLSDISDSDVLSGLNTCLINPTDPSVPNPPEKPIDNNFNNGGGDVTKADYIVNIHYLKDGQLNANPATDPILGSTVHPHPLVNSTYYADIQVLVNSTEPDGLPSYRDLSASYKASGAALNEIESITWNFYRGDLDPEAVDAIELNGTEQEKQDLLDAAFIAKAVNDNSSDKTFTTTDANGKSYYGFRTQLDNNEANTDFANAFNLRWPWDDININGENSQQRTRLRVTFDYDETVDVVTPQ